MGFLSSIFNPGASEAKRVKRASAQAQKVMDKGYAEARPLLTAGYDEAEGIIDAGYGGASDWLSDSYGQAFGQLGAGYDAAEDVLRDQYDIAGDRITAGRDLAREVLDPFYQSGLNAQGLYDTALGLDGRAAQEGFYDEYADYDPFRAFAEEQANRSLEQYYNARGLNSSGKGALALSRASLERGTEDLNNYLDRLERQGTRGAGVASEIAGLEERTGDKLGGLSSRLGEVLSSNNVDRGTREANMTYGHGQDQSNLSVGKATAQSNLKIGRGDAEANLVYGHAQQKANNITGTANAVNQAKAAGKQNLISGLSTVASAFIPGASGVSLAGNLASGVNRLLGGQSNPYSGNGYGSSWNPIIAPTVA